MLAPPLTDFPDNLQFQPRKLLLSSSSNVASFVKTSPPSTQYMLLLWHLSCYNYYFICLFPELLEGRDHVSLCFVSWSSTLYLMHNKPSINLQWESDQIIEWINKGLWQIQNKNDKKCANKLLRFSVQRTESHSFGRPKKTFIDYNLSM